jgi:hypothetical protein
VGNQAKDSRKYPSAVSGRRFNSNDANRNFPRLLFPEKAYAFVDNTFELLSSGGACTVWPIP